MADTKIQLPPDSTGASVDTVDVTTGAGTVKREVVSLGDPTTGANRAAVTAAGKLLVTPDSVALPANQSVNAAQLAGTATSVNSGTKDAGTLRVVLATDQPALTNKLLVTPDSVALPANQSVNLNQVGAAAITEGQKAMAASLPVVVASDQSVIPVSDNAGSLTVDAPVGTPAFVRLSDGAAAQVGQKTMALSLPVALASDQSQLPAVAEQRTAILHVTGTAAVNTALTITLPAAGAGLFHYITSIQWFKKYSVIGVAAGAGILITSTNLPGNPVWDTEQLASAAGTVIRVIDYQAHGPLRSAVANTATTIVAPLQLQTIWRGNVSYFTGA